MFRPTWSPSSGLQSSKRLNIVCVWWMLRSHHLAYKLYMRHKLCVSSKAADVHRYVVSRTGVIPLGLCRRWRWREGSGWRLAGLYASHLWERSKKLYVRGNRRCVLIPIWGTLSGTYMASD